MVKNLGIDFGSTYTMMSYYDEVNNVVKGIQTETGSIYVPSVACVDEFDNLLTGDDARDEMRSNPALRPFRAFKMLLHERDKAKLRSYGYTDHDPKEISRKFLEKYLYIAAEECGVRQFEHAVITVPELWVSDFSKMSGRQVLLDICEGFGTKEQKLLKNIKVVTEPVAASAFYAHNYKKHHNNQPFEGRIAVVDYGGGTLDVTLTQVTAKTGARSANTMEIDVEWSDGAGENHPNQIGDAGLAYMEKVTAMALAKAGFPNAKMDGKFLRVKDKLEKELMSRTRDLNNRIEQNYALGMDEMGEDQEEFTYAPYNGKKVSITYAMLYEVFAQNIYPVLETYINRLKIAALGENRALISADNLKVAVVGGFGQFPLVQKAVWEIFKCSDTALDITLGAEGGKQDAISFGAALIAAKVIYVKPTSKYSIGLRITRGGRETFDYAIICGQEVTTTEPQPLGGNWYAIGYDGSANIKNAPWIFATNNAKKPMRLKDGKMREFAYRMIPCPEVCQKLQTLKKGAYFFGFSMDDSGIYTLYIYPSDIKTGERIKKPKEILPLGNFNDIFGANVAFDPNDEDNLLYKYEKGE